MKFTTVALGAALSASALAYPGMGAGSMAELHNGMHLAERQAVEIPEDLQKSDLTPVGKEIKDCLLETTRGNCEAPAAKTYTPPGPLGSEKCAKDTCCVWDFIAKELVDLYLLPNGECSEDARTSIRLGFHDAGAWSKTSGFGGADGSMLLNPTEKDRPENNGLQEIIATGQDILSRYSKFGVGAADLIQFMATVATVTCPLGPRILSYVGRPDSADSPDGLLPDVHSDAATLIQLFKDKTISPVDLAALVGAHTTSEQDIVDDRFAGAPQDSTPGVWDVKFYTETVDDNAPSEVFKFPSDVNLSKDPATAPSFALFGNAGVGQAAWNAAFAKAYVRLSLLGVKDLNGLTDCTAVIPTAVTKKPSNSSSSSSVSQSKTVSKPSSKPTGKPTFKPTGKSTFRPTGKPTFKSTYYSNSTTPAGPIKTKTSSSYTKYTTSTVSTTRTHTITEHGVTKTVTSVEAAYTTVCPYEGEDDDDEYYPVTSSKKTTPTVQAKPEVKKPVSYVSSTPAAPVLVKTSSYYKASTTPVAPILEQKPKACYTVTTTVTVY